MTNSEVEVLDNIEELNKKPNLLAEKNNEKESIKQEQEKKDQEILQLKKDLGIWDEYEDFDIDNSQSAMDEKNLIERKIDLEFALCSST